MEIHVTLDLSFFLSFFYVPAVNKIEIITHTDRHGGVMDNGLDSGIGESSWNYIAFTYVLRPLGKV